MFTDAPPAAPAAEIQSMSPEQLADLDCLTVFMAAEGADASATEARRRGRVYADRLAKSDPSRDWRKLAASPDGITYGAFMRGQQNCPPKAQRTSLPEPRWEAFLTIANDLEIHLGVELGPHGHRLVSSCVRACRPSRVQVQDIGDAPLGLFQLIDGDDLVYSTWASGSAYRIRVWSVRGGDLAQVLEASTRDRPEFVTGPHGAAEVRTTEADGATQPRRTVVWRYDGAAFQRVP